MEVISKEKALAALRQLVELPNEMRVQAMAAVSRLKAEEAVLVVHGRWENVKETFLYLPEEKYTVAHTAETCSVCKVRTGFIGRKRYLYDYVCPNCSAVMDTKRINVPFNKEVK